MKLNLALPKTIKHSVFLVALATSVTTWGQINDPIVDAIVKEATQNSQLENYAFELIDVIGPRLVGTPQMLQAHNWVRDKYTEMGLEARNEAYGTWKAWERGTTAVALVSPRVKSLEAIQLAWSPSTGKKPVQAEVVVLADVNNKQEFEAWLPSVKGKVVLISMHQKTGRPEYQWEEYATKESLEKMKNQKETDTKAWAKRIANTGYSQKELVKVLEKAGASAIGMSFWTGIMGANRIFGAETTKIPTIDIALEDYGLLYRLAEGGKKPVITIDAQSKDLGTTPTYNTIAELKGSKKPDEYVVLGAHLDSWDGGSGATDNGTGILAMMEATRILKKVLPNPQRTILIGSWGSEEQGLNGSRAFVEDHPEITEKIQVALNQDGGTGRAINIPGEGFLHSYEFLGDWLAAVPQEYKEGLRTHFPSTPSTGGSDNASFVAVDVPSFYLGALSWDYGAYTWHTNRDTADKIVYDDVMTNAIMIAIIAYKASEQEEFVSRERSVLPTNSKGEKLQWPTKVSPKRN